METLPGRVVRITTTDEFEKVRAILRHRMGGVAVPWTATADYCIRLALEGLAAQAEAEKKRDRAAREYLLLLDMADLRRLQN